MAVADSYKHSCPVCGQHIEYTIDYCGKQIVCPSCTHSVVFPAVPPNPDRKPLRTARAAAEAAAAAAAEGKKFFALPWLRKLSEFEHWKIVLQCLVPFVLIGLLLAGASALKKHSTEEKFTAPVTQVDPNAWQKMADLARADQLVQSQLRNVLAFNAAAVAAQRTATAVRNQYNVTQDGTAKGSVMLRVRSADEAAAKAAQNLAYARQGFDAAFNNYQRLGGTIDYRGQLPR